MGRSRSSRRLNSVPSTDSQGKNIRRPIILLRRNSCGTSKCRAPRNSYVTRQQDGMSNKKLPEFKNSTTNGRSSGIRPMKLKQEVKLENCQTLMNANFSGKSNSHKLSGKYRASKQPLLPADPQTVSWDVPQHIPVVKVENQLSLPGFPTNAAFNSITSSQEFVGPKSIFDPPGHGNNYLGGSLGQDKGITHQMPPHMNYYGPASHCWPAHGQMVDAKGFWKDLPPSSDCFSEQKWQMLSAKDPRMLVTGHAGISKILPEIGRSHGYSICPVRAAEGTEDKAEATTVDDSLTNITWLGRMGINNFIPAQFDKGRREMLRLSARPDSNRRPPYSYMALIQFAINSSPNQRMTLRQIYLWIEEKFPYFKSAKSGWKNSIRHNLSLHDIFVREVSTTTKASYWTLRPDLNMRPLTLESISFGPGQKPILPHLPMCPQKYILLPVPTMCVSGMNGGGNYNRQQTDSSVSFQDSSSVFMDSGFGSDPSFMTPPNHPVNWCSAEQSYSLPRELGVEELRQPSKDQVDQTLPDTDPTRSSSRPVKRARKEPLKTLNDSLNSSLQFQKIDGESHISATLADSSEAQTEDELCSKENVQIKENMPFDSPPQTLLSDRSFSEIINDLESPFRTLLSRNNYDEITDMSSTDATKYTDHYSSDFSVGRSHNKQPHVIGNFPCTDIKTVPDELPGERGIGLELQTSTPVCSRRSKKRPHFSPTSSFGDVSSSLRVDRKPMPGDVPQSSDQDDSGIPYGAYDDFMNDLVGMVLKSPNRTGGRLQSCKSPMPSSSSASYSNASGTIKSYSGSSAHQNDGTGSREAGSSVIPSVFENATTDVLSNSFSKLLDLSGISLLGAGGYSASQLADIGDVSWSNLDNI